MFWFARIFAFYMFLLGCLPCVDLEHDGHSQQTSRQPVFKTADTQACGHHHGCNDLCSPLCTCACCGCVTTSVKEPFLEPLVAGPLVEEVQTGFFYQAPLSAAHIAALFRPPIPLLG